MQVYKHIILSILMLGMHSMYSVQKKAIIKDSVIEMNNSYPVTPNNLGIAPGQTNNKCQRAHQGLYNELVNIIEEKGAAIKISLKNITYKIDGSISTFWIHKNKIVELDTINNVNVLDAIPNQEYGEEPTIVLTYPWKGFSVGTRFKYLPKSDLQDFYAIVRGNYQCNNIQFDMIPHRNAIKEVQQDSLATRQLFVSIINNLVTRVQLDLPHYIIPYVWGGSSFVNAHEDNDFYQKDDVWERKIKKNIYTGYDCSEFVMRMAKIAGIDFPWKTTTAIKHGQRALTEHDILEDGDLIWIQGHVMIVSNIQKNELIEARAYSSGFGCIHRIKLCDIFENITTYDDIIKRYHMHQSLSLKNKEGDFYLKVDKFLLLKLIN